MIYIENKQKRKDNDMDLRLRAAWLSRHEPTPKQLEALRGYKVVMVNPEGRSIGAHDAWMTACTSAGGVPDAIFTLMNDEALKHLVKISHGRSEGKCEVVRPVYNHLFRDRWEGKWKRAIWNSETDKLLFVDWFPRPIVVQYQDVLDIEQPNFSHAHINSLRIR